MTTEWVVSAGTERVELTTSGTEAKPGPSIGEITFTVTNPGPVEDRAVFEIVPGDGAKKSWFTVDEPQRTVPAGQSVTYLVRMLVPVGEPAGPFWAQGRVYSADTAPEESSRLSGRFTGEVGATQKVRSSLWLVLAIAGLVIVVGGVVAWLVLRPDNEPDPQPSPSPSVTEPSPSPKVSFTIRPRLPMATAPDLAGKTKAQADQLLSEAGLKLGTSKRRYRPDGQGRITHQSVPPQSKVIRGASVDVEIAVKLAAPILYSPPNLTLQPTPELKWHPVPNAGSYLVRQEAVICPNADFTSPNCSYDLVTNQEVTGATSWKPGDFKLPDNAASGLRWHVIALDDFKGPGPQSGYFFYYVTTQ